MTTDLHPIDTVEAQPAVAEARTGGLIEPTTARSLAGIFKALSDPTRLRIISALAGREYAVGELAALLELEQSTLSHQLSDMRDMHLVQFRREGRYVIYRLDDEHVRALFAQGLAHVSHQ